MNRPIRALGRRLDTALARRGGRRHRTSSEDQFVTVDGCRLRVRDQGRGPLTLVFVPDPPNVLEHHTEVFDALASEVRVLGIELPGFGHSVPRADFGFTIGDNRDVLMAALDALGVTRAVLCLSCVAGLVSVAAARERPDLVRGIVGIQTPDLPAALAWARRVDPGGLIHAPLMGQVVVRAQRRRLAHLWYGNACGRREMVPALTEEAVRAYDAHASYALASALQGLPAIDDNLFSVLEELPALSLWGALDRTHRRTEPAALRRYLPRLEVAILDDAGHFPDLERPAAVRASLFDWLERSVID